MVNLEKKRKKRENQANSSCNFIPVENNGCGGDASLGNELKLTND